MYQCIMFYSYKGGTGRTSALLNAAALLVQSGYKVGVIDLDFDAPGIAPLFDIDVETHDFLRMIVDRSPVAEIEAHCFEVDLGEGVKISCLPCSGEQELIDRINWTDATVTGYMRDAISSFASGLNLDYILLDTRSGISYTAAFSIQLTNHAVLVCRLDRQNQIGMARLRSICRERDVAYTIVANSVPINSTDLPDALKKFLETVGQMPDVLVPYEQKLYFREQVIAHLPTSKRTKIGKSYSELVERLRNSK